MGAKLANPEKLCVNFWGDAAIGFTGMDFETAVRERIPILSVLSNNFSMAIELKVMQTATEKYRSTDISGNYADFAKALGGYGERVTEPDDIVPAIQRGGRQDARGRAGPAGVHHREGRRLLDVRLNRFGQASSEGCRKSAGRTRSSHSLTTPGGGVGEGSAWPSASGVA